jgi:hypothetical protein
MRQKWNVKYIEFMPGNIACVYNRDEKARRRSSVVEVLRWLQTVGK